MLTLVLACGDYDRTRPLIDGRVAVEGCALAPVVLPPHELFPRAFQRTAFDIAELSASTYIVQLSRGTAAYVAIPVFLSRAFRYDSIYVRADGGIAAPKDLEGRIVGIPEYQLTLGVWLRGILQDEYGVDFRKLRYRTGGLDTPGRAERVPLSLPADIDCAPTPAGKSLNDLLLSGAIDALLSPRPPRAFVERRASVRRLFADPAALERDYFGRTAMFPIMHLVGIRRELVAAHPALPARLFAAFSQARDIAMRDLRSMAQAPALPLMLPWLGAAIESTEAAMGADFWPYGVARNRRELDALCRYAHEQHLADRPVAVEELFAEATLQT